MSFYYRFTHNSFRKTHFTWAYSLISRSPQVNTTCVKCGTRRNYPSGEFDVIVEGGEAYPDILGCGAFPFLILSENAVQVFNDYGITSFHTYHVGVRIVKARALLGKDPPAYFRIEIDGSCKIDVKASGAKITKYCKKCHYIETMPMVLPNLSIITESWDGSPLFRDNILYPSVTFCTQDLVDVVKKKGLTNFSFTKEGEIG